MKPLGRISDPKTKVQRFKGSKVYNGENKS